MKAMKAKKCADVTDKGMGQKQVVKNYDNGGSAAHKTASKVMMRGPGQNLADKNKKPTRGI